MRLKIEYLDHYPVDAGPLRYAHASDSGFDLRAAIAEPMILMPHHVYKIPTGVIVHTPAGFELQVRPRSGHSSKGTWAAFGTVDAGYRGELQVVISQVTNGPKKIRPGDRIAQAVLTPVLRAELLDIRECGLEEGDMPADSRGSGGFNSTGTD